MKINNELSLVETCLKEKANKFISNPNFYFYEEDIRADFAFYMLEKIQPTTFTHVNREISTLPIKFEYPSSFASKQRHDIVFLRANASKNIYSLDISIAIELKLGSLSYDRCAKFKEDILKLLGGYSNKEFTGIAVYFYQDNIDSKLFKEWFNDTVESFEIINSNEINLEESKVNTFIITPEYILEAKNYRALIKI